MNLPVGLHCLAQVAIYPGDASVRDYRLFQYDKSAGVCGVYLGTPKLPS